MRFSVSAIALLCLVGFVRSNSLAKLKRDTGDELPTISIVGGTEAAAGEFPFLTVLHLNGILCGGTLIGPRHVLTAAHCLYGFSATAVTSFIVFANTLSVYGSGTGTVTSGVSKFIIHQNYNPKIYGNDVALLVLKTTITTIPFISLPTDPAAADMTNITVMQPTTAKPITTTKPTITKKPTTTKPTTTMKPRTTKSTLKTTVKTTLKSTVKAPVRAFSTYENATAVIAGWGTTSSVKGGSVSQVLLKANVTVLANSVCSSQYGSAFVGANQLCASAPGKDTCQGDSGGPIIANGVQIGITSFGASCALSDYAGVYTRVSTYVGWIATTRAKNP